MMIPDFEKARRLVREMLLAYLPEKQSPRRCRTGPRLKGRRLGLNKGHRAMAKEAREATAAGPRLVS